MNAAISHLIFSNYSSSIFLAIHSYKNPSIYIKAITYFPGKVNLFKFQFSNTKSSTLNQLFSYNPTPKILFEFFSNHSLVYVINSLY